MATRTGAVHVATTIRRYKGRIYETHLLRRTYRQDGKVKHQTLGNISHLPPDLIELIRRRLRGEGLPSGDEGDRLAIMRSLPHGHVAAVLAVCKQLGLERLLASRASPQRALTLALIVARVIDPGSKLATVRSLAEPTATSSLAVELGLQLSDEREVYEAMDWLVGRQKRIETKLAARHLHNGSLVLYDLSSSFYTGTHCSLAAFGHSRDRKNGYPQIVYGLLCNGEGCPVAVEVFKGNTADPTTLPNQIRKLRERFHLERIVLVGDRGMITSRRIDEDLRGVEGLQWITALRSQAIRKLVEQGVAEISLFDEQDLLEVQSEDYPGERLVVCRNPLLAAERTRKREALLQATEKQLDAVVAATRRDTRPLRSKERIALRIGKFINRNRMGKHFILDITEESFSYRRDQEKIAAEAALDGLYVIRTSVPARSLSSEATVSVYKNLSRVERAFRSIKTVDLKIRPVYHRLEQRVRAHVFLCMLAYYVEWHMRARLKPLLFDDQDIAGAQALRSSIVAPAQRSESAKRKDRMKSAADGSPVQSFQGLLSHLGTLTKNRIRADRESDVEFYLLTQPTELQRRTFELLDATP